MSVPSYDRVAIGGPVFLNMTMIYVHTKICSVFNTSPPIRHAAPSARVGRRALTEHYGNAAADTGCVHW